MTKNECVIGLEALAQLDDADTHRTLRHRVIP